MSKQLTDDAREAIKGAAEQRRITASIYAQLTMVERWLSARRVFWR